MSERPPVAAPFCTTPVCIGITVLCGAWVILNIHRPSHGIPVTATAVYAWRENAKLNAYRAWEQAEIIAGRPLPKPLSLRQRWQHGVREFHEAPIACTAMMALPLHIMLLLCGGIGAYILYACFGINSLALGAILMLILFSLPVSFIVTGVAVDRHERKKQQGR